LDLEVDSFVQEIVSPRREAIDNLKKINFSKYRSIKSERILRTERQWDEQLAPKQKSSNIEIEEIEVLEISSPRDIDSPREEFEVDSTQLPTNKIHLFFHFAKVGNLEALIELHEREHIDLNVMDETKLSAIHFSTMNNQLSVLEYLVKKGVPVDSKDKFERTPLLIAVSKGYKEIFHFLLQNGASIHTKDSYGYAAIHLALKSRFFTIANDLIFFGADLNVRNFNGFTPLHLCLQIGDSEVLDYLVSKEIKTNLKNQNEETPLMTGVKNNQLSCVSVLFSVPSVDKLCKNQLGQNILHVTCEYGYFEMLTLIMRKMSEEEFRSLMDMKDFKGRVPLHYCCSKNHLKCLKKLKDFISDINVQDKRGNTPLHLSLQSSEVSLYLIGELHADKNIKNDESLSPKDLNLKMDFPLDFDWNHRFNISTSK
jgi:ankyrin repeat protein